VAATAKKLESPPLTRIRDEDIAFVLVTLHNGSQQVAVVNGDAAQASIDTKPAPAAGGRYLVEVSRPKLTEKKLVAVATVSAVTGVLAGPIFHEYVEPSQYRHRSLGEAIGVDGTRHQVEGERFGVRVLMPGDESVGWMAFECLPEQNIKSVSVPISFSRSLTPDGVLDVPVSGGAAPGGSSTLPGQATPAPSDLTGPAPQLTAPTARSTQGP
jgi:hypothetical protein